MIRTVARLTVAVALSAAALAAVAPAAAPASTPSASLRFVNQAKLQESGTALVTLNYSCNPSQFGSEGFVAARLEQPGAFGEAFTTATCDGVKHRVTLELEPGPFTRGTATAQAVVDNMTGSSFAEARAELKVK